MQDVLHQHMAQPGGEPHRRHGGKVLGAHRHHQADHTQRHHKKTHFDNIPGIAASDALIHDPCHNQRHQQLKGRFQQLKQRPENALLFVAFQVL